MPKVSECLAGYLIWLGALIPAAPATAADMAKYPVPLVKNDSLEIIPLLHDTSFHPSQPFRNPLFRACTECRNSTRQWFSDPSEFARHVQRCGFDRIEIRFDRKMATADREIRASFFFHTDGNTVLWDSLWWAERNNRGAEITRQIYEDTQRQRRKFALRGVSNGDRKHSSLGFPNLSRELSPFHAEVLGSASRSWMRFGWGDLTWVVSEDHGVYLTNAKRVVESEGTDGPLLRTMVGSTNPRHKGACDDSLCAPPVISRVSFSQALGQVKADISVKSLCGIEKIVLVSGNYRDTIPASGARNLGISRVLVFSDTILSVYAIDINGQIAAISQAVHNPGTTAKEDRAHELAIARARKSLADDNPGFALANVLGRFEGNPLSAVVAKYCKERGAQEVQRKGIAVFVDNRCDSTAELPLPFRVQPFSPLSAPCVAYTFTLNTNARGGWVIPNLSTLKNLDNQLINVRLPSARLGKITPSILASPTDQIQGVSRERPRFVLTRKAEATTEGILLLGFPVVYSRPESRLNFSLVYDQGDGPLDSLLISYILFNLDGTTDYCTRFADGSCRNAQTIPLGSGSLRYRNLCMLPASQGSIVEHTEVNYKKPVFRIDVTVYNSRIGKTVGIGSVWSG